jgi:hypothetical protein
VQKATLDLAGSTRLEEIRRSMAAPVEAGPTPAAVEAAPEQEAITAGDLGLDAVGEPERQREQA